MDRGFVFLLIPMVGYLSSGLQKCGHLSKLREVVKTILHARDPLLGGGGG